MHYFLKEKIFIENKNKFKKNWIRSYAAETEKKSFYYRDGLRGAQISRRERVRKRIRKKMDISINALQKVEEKKLRWYGYIKRKMEEW